MNWLLLTVLAIFARATLSIATKLVSENVKASAITQAVFFTGYAGLFAIPVGMSIDGISFSGLSDYWLAALIMVVSQAFGNILFLMGMKRLDAGTAQIGHSSILIWGAILSVVFLGSTFTLIQSLGIVLLLIAIVFVKYQKGIKGLDPGMLLILLASFLFAIFQVASAELSDTLSTGTYLIIAYFGPTTLIGFFYFNTLKKDFAYMKKNLGYISKNAAFASGASLTYFVFSYLAYQKAPDSGVVVVLLTTQVILSVLFGIIFLKEYENMPRKLAASSLAVLAGYLIVG